MATSVLPTLIDALIATARTTLPATTTVYDGTGAVDNEPGDFLMIGVDDPDNPDSIKSGSSQQDWANSNYTATNETGEVICAAMSWNGDADQKAARDAVYATLAAFENALRATPALGIPTVLWTKFGPNQDLTQNQTEDGALALVVFTVSFRARI